MTVDRLISPEVPVLKPGDSGTRALELMEDNHLSQLPVVSGENYLALVTEHDIAEWKDPDSPVSDADYSHFKPAIVASAHPYEAMRVMHQMNLSLLPVIDNDFRYIGSVTNDSLLRYLIDKSGIDNPGGIIVVEIAPRNYSLYEIARICENEDVAILSLEIHTAEHGMMEVTLKLNRTTVDAVVASLERHNYRVIEVFGENENKEDLSGNYDLLMNYLNM